MRQSERYDYMTRQSSSSLFDVPIMTPQSVCGLSSDDGSTYLKLRRDGDLASQATGPRKETAFRGLGSMPPPSGTVRAWHWIHVVGRGFSAAVPRNESACLPFLGTTAARCRPVLPVKGAIRTWAHRMLTP